MTRPICIFEDHRTSQLHPLALTRPVFDLRCGMSSLREKIVRHFDKTEVILHCRAYLQELVEQENPGTAINHVETDGCLFINGRLLMDEKTSKAIDTYEERLFVNEGQVVAAFLRGANQDRFVNLLENQLDLNTLSEIDRVELEQACFINYLWDIVNENASEIERDFAYFDKGGVITGEVDGGAILVERDRIYIGTDAVVKPGAILDAESGPIYIGENAMVMHNAVIEGPAFLGRGSTIKIAAKIYEGTSIGEVCKIGGEVEESIIHSHSNKQHDGFLGHAYLGQWVNLGADTNNSDLKNNYGSVKVPIEGKLVDSGSMFVGLFMGDHSKAGINTMFNTGTAVGAMCNVYGAGFPPKYVPSFSWGGADGLVEHDLDKALQTAGAVMKRRDKKLTQVHEQMFRHLFEKTQVLRNRHIA